MPSMRSAAAGISTVARGPRRSIPPIADEDSVVRQDGSGLGHGNDGQADEGGDLWLEPVRRSWSRAAGGGEQGKEEQPGMDLGSLHGPILAETAKVRGVREPVKQGLDSQPVS